MSGQHISDANLSQGSLELNSYLLINLFRSVTLKNIPFVHLEPTKEQSVTMATIGVFVGGMALGGLATLLVVGIVFGAVKLKRKETARK